MESPQALTDRGKQLVGNYPLEDPVASDQERVHWEEAAALFRAAIAQGYPEAMHTMAMVLMAGKIGPVDGLGAEALLVQAIEAGHTRSNVLMGILYRVGTPDVQRDLAMAAARFRQLGPAYWADPGPNPPGRGVIEATFAQATVREHLQELGRISDVICTTITERWPDSQMDTELEGAMHLMERLVGDRREEWAVYKGSELAHELFFDLARREDLFDRAMGLDCIREPGLDFINRQCRVAFVCRQLSERYDESPWFMLWMHHQYRSMLDMHFFASSVSPDR